MGNPIGSGNCWLRDDSVQLYWSQLFGGLFDRVSGGLMADGIDNLPFTDEERAKLRSFGVKGLMALLSLRKASKEAFDAQFNPGRAEEIAEQLKKLLTDQELEALQRPVL